MEDSHLYNGDMKPFAYLHFLTGSKFRPQLHCIGQGKLKVVAEFAVRLLNRLSGVF